MAFILCVLAATSIGICFKLFPGWKINVLNAIVVNYTACLLLGLLFEKNIEPSFKDILHQPWFEFDLILGFLFMMGFNLAAYSIRKYGITPSVMMQKMSIILSVAFAVFLFKEHFGWVELMGSLMAITAIIAINTNNKSTKADDVKWRVIILVLLWLTSALIEIVLYYVERTNIVADQHQLFTTLGFGVAGILGWIVLSVRLIFKKKILTWKDIVAGLILSIPNYFSVYLVLVMLKNGWNGSIMYPLLNVCVLLFSTLAAVLFFRESLSTVNRFGVVAALLAILLISLAQNGIL